MRLHEVIASIESREKTLSVYAAPEDAGIVEELREYFASQNLTVVHEPIEADQSLHAVLSERGRFVRAFGSAALESLVDPDHRREIDETPAYAPLIERLDGTTFTSYDREQMLTTSREIEDRAWRMGEGRLHAGFQRFSWFADQVDVYRRLGEIDLDVHVYGKPDREPPSGPYVCHATDDPEIAATWFVAYDGGGEEVQKTALLAEEREDAFYGLWTYDPSIVDRVFAALDRIDSRHRGIAGD